MIVWGSCVGDGGARHAAVCQPWLDRVRHPDDLVVRVDGKDGICTAYNHLIDLALSHDDLELLVLLHDDLKVVDPNARRILLDAARVPGSGVIGLAGGSHFPGVRWWEGATLTGALYEPRGLLPVHRHHWSGEVDAVDGALLALTPEALRTVRFDSDTFPAFHGYDVDVCAQAHAAGLRVEVVRLDAFHTASAGVKDADAFLAAHRAARVKWADRHGGSPHSARARRAVSHLGDRARTLLRDHARPLQRVDEIEEIALGASGARLLATSAADLVRVWLVPRDDAQESHRRLLHLAERAGVPVAQSRLLSPPTDMLPRAAAFRRAQHLARGGSWPIFDLVELTVGHLADSHLRVR